MDKNYEKILIISAKIDLSIAETIAEITRTQESIRLVKNIKKEIEDLLGVSDNDKENK